MVYNIVSFLRNLNEGNGIVNTIENYNVFVEKYKHALNEVEVLIYNIIKVFCKEKKVYCMLGSRIKSKESIEQKMKRKNKPINLIWDIAGIRVVFCDWQDCKDMFSLDDEIKSWDKNDFSKNFNNTTDRYNDNFFVDILHDFKDYILEYTANLDGYKVIFNEQKDYVTNPKENGYQSIHLVIKFNDIPVELQIRNLHQHLFAQYDHMHYYKGNESTDTSNESNLGGQKDSQGPQKKYVR